MVEQRAEVEFSLRFYAGSSLGTEYKSGCVGFLLSRSVLLLVPSSLLGFLLCQVLPKLPGALSLRP